MKYYITKDKYLNKYILWEKHNNYEIAKYIGYKYQCIDYLKYVIGGYFENIHY